MQNQRDAERERLRNPLSTMGFGALSLTNNLGGARRTRGVVVGA